ncbi:MAG: SGNH/GDSL hydrolase family protein [Pseudomonadota bacterium]
MRTLSICKTALFGMLALSATVAFAEDGCGKPCRGNWVASWGTAQQLAVQARAIPARETPPPKVEAQTVRMVARSTIAGKAIRLALSNSFGYAPVRIDAVQIARAAAGAAITAGSNRTLTFGGRQDVTLVPGAQIYSDPIAFDVPAQADLAVSLYLAKDSGPTTAHPMGMRTAWLAPGNQVAAQKLEGATEFRSYVWLAGIDVLAADKAATIVAFGDSITDGFATTNDADAAWPAFLARRLAAQGNLLLEAINDISFNAFRGIPASEKLSAQDIIAGYRLLIGRAHLHGLTIIGCTLTAFEGVPTFTADGEKMRQEVNRWIRDSDEFDAVIDFDVATRDPAAPTKLRPAFDSGDHIHPNDAGNKAMAEAIDLKLFH